MSLKMKALPFAITAATVSLSSYGAGFQVSEQSASGLGRAFAGEAAVADNAAVIARNPAAMTRFKRAEVSGAITVIDADIDVDSTDGNGRHQTAHDIAPTQAVPAAYFVQPINDKLAFGLGLFSNYGVTSDYDESFAPGTAAGKTSLITLNLNPSLAYKVNDQLSVGGGISLVYADAELIRRYGADANWFPTHPAPSDKTIELAGDTYSWGWNVGGLYEFDENNRFGLSYRAQVDLNFEGDFTDYTGQVVPGLPSPGGQKVDGELDIVLPATAEFSGFHQLNDRVSVQYSILWTDWSAFKEIKATSSDCSYHGQSGVCLAKDEDFEDSMRYAVGASYLLNPQWTLRAGLAYDEKGGQPTLSIPDSNRYWYTAGATYHYSDSLSFDAGLAYVQSEEASFTEGGTLLDDDYALKSNGDAYLASLQVNYKL
ncbi:long-chain fatty acid transport protein [Sinobacterium caligoides]|uniref:Long-chain fatty acid transport protein n=1 Tax=Sinobacterium caligoides TaxID=933926 RepID=A0A3N2DKB0_9GAMM|nr:outer membrane protein transport protein [Sinobacterium caligoides]ROS00243.1 long-chain fatty acid transport protein [Sinobacterium caligoides]